MLSYKEALEFVEESKQRGSVLGLTNMRALMEALGNPQNRIPTIHIAGSNGKGSVGAYLASICKEAGFKVGRYCTPAVFDPLECWQYDGDYITEEEYASCMSQVKDACDIVASKGIFPTSFELETALAFVYFANRKPDVFLLETGMGGATDATNVVDNPLACVFTKISRDHMQFLGETLEEITSVKAGIMKPGAYIFWGEQEPEVEKVLNRKFEEVCAEGKKIGKETVLGDVYVSRTKLVSQRPGELRFTYLGVNYMTRMAGLYQMQNAALAIAVFDALWPKLLFGLSDEMEMWNDKEAPLAGWMDMEYASRAGVLYANWPGRFEVLGENPLFIADGAHNEDAAIELAKTVRNSFTNPSLTYIIGVLADKEHKKMLELMLPFAKQVYTITPQNSRGMDGKLLAEEVEEVSREFGYDVAVCYCDTVAEAVEKACAYGKQEEVPVLAFGSLSYLGLLKHVYQNYMLEEK